jgi:hypothetical protein
VYRPGVTISDGEDIRWAESVWQADRQNNVTLYVLYDASNGDQLGRLPSLRGCDGYVEAVEVWK